MLIGYTEAETEDTIQHPSMGRRSWRWRLDIHPLELNLTHTLNYGVVPNSEWRASGSYFSIAVYPLRWGWGFDQAYYDGMHYSYQFGPLWISWCV